MKSFGVTEPRAFERKLGQNEIKNGDKSTESVLQEGQLSDGGSEKKRRIIYELGLRERLCFAATMGLALILLIGYGYFGDAEHKHLSIGFMALLFLHLILNRRQQVLSRASEIVKNALVLAVSLCLVSGVLLSRYDLPFFPNIPHADLIGGVHLASACDAGLNAIYRLFSFGNGFRSAGVQCRYTGVFTSNMCDFCARFLDNGAVGPAKKGVIRCRKNFKKKRAF